MKILESHHCLLGLDDWNHWICEDHRLVPILMFPDADKDGMCVCVTCNTKLPRKQIQNGHFVSRGVMKYRFDIKNCHPQCYKCNCLLNWNYKPYTVYMVKEYGMNTVLIMLWDRTLKEYKQYEYEEMIIQWYKEIQETKRKIKWNKKE